MSRETSDSEITKDHLQSTLDEYLERKSQA